MEPVSGPGLEPSASPPPRHSRQPSPPHARQQWARPGSRQLSPGSLQDWSPATPWAQLPPVHAVELCPRCVMQPVSPAKTTTANTENIARFMSEDSFLLLSYRAGETILIREARLCLHQTSVRHSLESRKSAEPVLSAGRAFARPLDLELRGVEGVMCPEFAGAGDGHRPKSAIRSAAIRSRLLTAR
jgi:hypothetical protein